MTIDNFVNEVKKITSLNDLKAFKQAVEGNYAWLAQHFNGKNADELVLARAKFTDELLCHAWRLLSLDGSKHLSLCAVGGYGRGQLQPYSDIDLLILSKKPLSNTQQDTVSQFITFLWDIKLEIGQAVRTIKDTIQLAKEDITIATNLVEARLLAGCKDTFDALMKKAIAPRTWSSKDFFKAKLDEQIKRHHKFNDTSYNLEPNIKENPGCLRDIQSIGWVAKKHFQEYDGTTLIGHGYFTELEHAELIECRSALWQIRFALHIIAGRSENRLLFDYQPQVAKLLGYGEDKPAVEKLMKHLFRIVQRVSELNSMLLQRFSSDILGQSRKKIYCFNQDFCVQDGKLIPQHDNCFPSPVAILSFLELLTKNPEIKGLDGKCIRQLRNARRKFQSNYYHEYEDCRKKFIELVSNPDFFDLAWDIMHLHGILRAYLPEWDNIVGMMQFDLFHAYTVDEHTHRLVKYVRRYYLQKEEFPRCSRIVNDLDEPQVLFIAAIFHDIAKGRGGDHSKLGAKDVYAFCQQHEISEKNTQMIAWLVENHLLMSVVAQRRDIYDPDVVKEFASAVKSQSHLELLYALTLADIRATNNNLWNDWKASLLRELYLLTHKALDNGLQCQDTLAERVVSHKRQAALKLEELQVAESVYLPFWSQMNDDYFTRFKPEQIAWHTKTITSIGSLSPNEVLVAASNETSRAGTELLIYCHDRPALFAQIASVLDSRNCSIHDAQIVVTKDDYVFDSMIILDENAERISSQARANNIASAVKEQLLKPGRSHSNQRRMSRQMRQLDVPTKVRFFDTQDASTLIELEALDAPGLLARIGHLFVDLNITLKMAKITTIGERAEDVFIITNADGQALTHEQKVLLRKQLKIKLDQPEVNTAI
ncbi:[protein-PII] uridylyltransferase [Agaribacter flavus]|uniref:Bifunctional uridylyltransferase/uridylyl-removing enzyme n=1 Tax=Agaribacter flavus TaxID=1902781 RepID=A0ABV7FSV4_9ALTE